MPIHRHVVKLIGVYQQQDTYRIDYHHPPQRTQNQSPCSDRYLSTNKHIKTINSSSLSKYPKMLLLNLKGCLPKFSYLKVSEKLENVGTLDSPQSNIFRAPALAGGHLGFKWTKSGLGKSIKSTSRVGDGLPPTTATKPRRPSPRYV